MDQKIQALCSVTVNILLHFRPKHRPQITLRLDPDVETLHISSYCLNIDRNITTYSDSDFEWWWCVRDWVDEFEADRAMGAVLLFG